MTQIDTPTSGNVTTQRIEELGRIILAYSEVTEKLQETHGLLTRKVEQLQQELSEKNRELERRNRLAALGEMAAGMAHEIRNPLGGIQLYASMLAQDVADRPGCAEIVRKIRTGVARMEEIVSQVLHFSREIKANCVACDLVPVVQDAVDLLKAKADANQVNVEMNLPEALDTRLDARLMTQAILNLVQNAIEANPPGGRVFVTLRPFEGGQLHLTVADTGYGIPVEMIDRVFNPFFTTKDDGTGLGLSIVHRIIEAHGGSITAGNRPEGGAKFEVRI